MISCTRSIFQIARRFQTSSPVVVSACVATSPLSVSSCNRSITTIIMGPPGGGKGTISKKMIKDFGFDHISTGDLLRAEIEAGTSLGVEAKNFMDKGDFVPDSLVINMILGRIERIVSDGKHVLLDGFPRTLVQAEQLAKSTKVDIALNLTVPIDDIIERISNRWIHKTSGRVYAYDYNPPKIDGLDDETGEPLIQRDDDKPEAVRQRLKVYENSTAPLIKYYSDLGVLNEFDGSDYPDLIAANRRSDAIYASVKPYLTSRM